MNRKFYSQRFQMQLPALVTASSQLQTPSRFLSTHTHSSPFLTLTAGSCGLPPPQVRDGISWNVFIRWAPDQAGFGGIWTEGLSPPAQVHLHPGNTEASMLLGFMYEEEHLPFRQLAPVLAPFPIPSRHPASPGHSSHWPQNALSGTSDFFSKVDPRWMAPAITVQSSFYFPRPLDSTSSKKLLPREKGGSDHHRRAGRGPCTGLPRSPKEALGCFLKGTCDT